MSTTSNYPRSVQISVHLDAILHNYLRLRDRANSKAFAVIKADAYGHGADAVASYLSAHADGFAVVTVGEAIAVRDTGVEQPILVLQGPQDDDDIDAIYRHGLWPALHDEAQIAAVANHRNALDIEPWLKVDTGMGRLGVSLDSAQQHLQRDQLRWRGVLSHLASADDPTNSYTSDQAERFEALLVEHDIDSSLANSAGVLAWPKTQRNWARLGIGLYGSHPVEQHTDGNDYLKPAMTVTAPVISVKKLEQGQSVGYSQTYRCPEDMTVAYLGAGYADGLSRVIDASADVLLSDMRCPIIGRVSMDSIAVDCRALPAAPELGQQAMLWGPYHPVERMAGAAGTITYELLTHITGQRRYTD